VFIQYTTIYNTATNKIYSRSKYASEMSKLFLMETFCLPLISYGCECIYYDSKKASKLSACWNNPYRSFWNACVGFCEGNTVFCVKDWILGIYISWRNFCFYIGFYIDLIMQFLNSVLCRTVSL